MAGAVVIRRFASLGAFRSLQTFQMLPKDGQQGQGQNRNSCTYNPTLTFAPGQNGGGEQRIGPLVAEQQKKGRLFYGIEVLARTRKEPVNLDFNTFLPVLPIFVSVVWHSLRYWDVEPISEVDCIVLCKLLAKRLPTMPHLTCYRMSKQRMDQFLDLEFKNLLALRGDDAEPKQEFTFSADLTQFAKCRFGDRISVSVAGFPDGYTRSERTPEHMERNLKIMKAKVEAGADCIITQMCYKPDAIIKYVKDCRAAGITVPILLGIMAPDTYACYKNMIKKGEAELPPDLAEEVERLQCEILTDPSQNSDQISQFFVNYNVRLICEVLAACDDVWGIVFFTLNRFGSVHLTLKELQKIGLFNEVS
ncbi:methylenetetrahydrofolate reductase (NADPH)-like [Drosophila kikkawai]|uniref:Methylenetetrahydrofolate reductase (NADPH)-like n=1 Tax=Drosophila kikkawai TaxID=30033 RepID=A0A6P4HZC3_DROKI|nr:methylenetetrahydrofolate reductase-like [Drosophila kikkawai]